MKGLLVAMEVVAGVMRSETGGGFGPARLRSVTGTGSAWDFQLALYMQTQGDHNDSNLLNTIKPT